MAFRNGKRLRDPTDVMILRELVEDPRLGTAELVEADDGSWRYKEPAMSMERFWFTNRIDGRPQVLLMSGSRYGRFHDKTL